MDLLQFDVTFCLSLRDAEAACIFLRYFANVIYRKHYVRECEVSTSKTFCIPHNCKQ